MELDDDHDGSENFFAGHAHVVVHVGKNRRLHEGTLLAAGNDSLRAARDDLRAFRLANLHVIQNLFQLTRVNLAAHLRIRFPRQTDLDALELRLQRRKEFIVNRILHEDSTARAAHLPLVEEDAHARAFDSFFPRHVLEVNVRALAAELQRRGD